MATPFPFTAGQVLTAAQMNAIGEWIDYTPTWTNLTVGNAVQDFRYIKVNKFISVVGVITLGSTSSITGTLSFTLPQTAVTYASANERFGVGTFEDAGTDAYDAWVLYGSTTTARLRVPLASGTYINTTAVSSTVPFTWTTSDRISVNFIYEAA
jgi:hypothetical protein